MPELPPNQAALANAEELSIYSKGKIGASDPRSEIVLAGATSAIRKHCGWHVTPAVDDSATLDGEGGHLLQLATKKLNRLDSVTENGEALVEYDPATGEGVYEWSATGDLRRVRGHWTHRYRGVEVVFNHGYDHAPELKQIVLQVCAAALASPMGATREQAAQLSVSWATTAPGVAGGLSLLERDLNLLNAYRLPGRA